MDSDGQPEEERDSPVSSVSTADCADMVAALPFDPEDAALPDGAKEEVEEDDFDEQPTHRRGALTEEEAEKVAAASDERRSMRVFKRPSSPQELAPQRQTASLQAQDPAPSQRPKIAAVVLLVAVACGGVFAWGLHTSPSRTTELTPRASSPSTMGPSMTPSPVTMAPLPTPIARPEAEEVSGPERADELLEEAEGVVGPARRALLEEAAAADPANPHPAAGLAEYYMDVDASKALEWALHAAQLRRRRASYRDLVADAHERLGHAREAAAARAAAEALRAED